jgi:hypothetical protein
MGWLADFKEKRAGKIGIIEILTDCNGIEALDTEAETAKGGVAAHFCMVYLDHGSEKEVVKKCEEIR